MSKAQRILVNEIIPSIQLAYLNQTTGGIGLLRFFHKSSAEEELLGKLKLLVEEFGVKALDNPVDTELNLLDVVRKPAINAGSKSLFPKLEKFILENGGKTFAECQKINLSTEGKNVSATDSPHFNYRNDWVQNATAPGQQNYDVVPNR